MVCLAILAGCRTSPEGLQERLSRNRCEGTGVVAEASAEFPKPGRPYGTFLGGQCGRVEGSLGSHCWSYAKMGFCADAFGPAPPTHRLVVGSQERLSLYWGAKAIPQELNVEILTWPDKGAAEREAKVVGRDLVGFGHTEQVRKVDVSKDNPTTLVLNVAEGRYLLKVDSWWARGDMSHTFAVTVRGD
jgi:hypothetical protein